MATLILATSCAHLKRPAASSTSNSGTDRSSFGDNNSGGANTQNTCGTTEHAVTHDTSAAANIFHGDNSRHDSISSLLKHNPQDTAGYGHQGESHPRQGNGGMEIIGKLQALPLQCDVTVIPRAHPNDLPSNTTSLNTEDSNDNGGEEIVDSMQPLRTKQHFHPCGMENIVRLGGTLSSDFILSLANCGVYIDNMDENNDGKTKLPVQAVPSSFSFPSVNENDDNAGLFSRDMPYYSYSEGEKRSVEEALVAFDFSIAVDVYRQRVDGIRRAEMAEAAVAALGQSSKHHDEAHVNTQSWNQERTVQDTATNTKSMEINSIMSTLEQESQFIKKTLFVLGSLGCVLLICMMWTIWKLERGRRARKRSSGSNSNRVQVKRVFVDVPCEIIETSDAKSRGVASTFRSNPSIRSSGKAHFPEEISPIRSSVSLNGPETTDKAEELVTASKSGKQMHETLHLITPQDVIANGSTRSKSDEDKQSSSSPRHWYEDFLSPRGCSKKAQRNRSDTALFLDKEDVARSLFCSSSSSSSNKVSPSVDNKDSLYSSKGASSSVLNAPKKKKVLVTPVERSSLSPPPSNVSLLKLSQDIEASKSPLMMTTETEETHDSSTRDDHDDHPTSIEVVDKTDPCAVSPVSTSEPIKQSSTEVNTPMPKRSKMMKTPAADITVSSQESLFSSSQREREIFAEELAKKAGLTPSSDFSTSIAIRAAEVQTPKKTLTPLSASSSLCDDEPSPFLADYWET